MELPKYIVMKVDCEPKSTTVTITDISDRCEVIEHEAEQTEPKPICESCSKNPCKKKEMINAIGHWVSECTEFDRKTEPKSQSLLEAYFKMRAEEAEPQTDGYMTAEQAEDYRKMLDKAEHKVYGNIEDEPQTDCSWK